MEEDCGPQWVKLSHVQELREMGFKEKAVRQALAAADDSVSRALDRLQVGGDGTCCFGGTAAAEG